jgi:hypothetical protein
MQLLRLRKDYTNYNGVEWCDITLLFTVDGVERFKHLITIPSADSHALVEHRRACWPMEYAAKAIGITPWVLQTMIQLLNRYAEWEIKDGDASELDDCPHLHSQPLS